jgi:hypothetical protein
MKLTQNQYYGLRSELPHSLNPGSVYLCEDTREFFIYGESGTPSELKISNEIIGVTQEDIDRTVLEATNALILGTVINVVSSYSQLPLAELATGKFYFVDSEQGTKWLPGSLGGTYYPKGLYHSTGVVWSYVEQPYQANYTEVNLGVNDDKFVTPYTLNNYSKWNSKYDASNPNGYISSVPAQTFDSITNKPFTLSGYGITDAYPLSSNPSGFLTSYSETDPIVRAINGIVKSNGTNIAAAIPGTDYVIPSGNVNSANTLVGLTASIATLNNQSGINTGNQTSIVGITGTKAQFDAAITDGNIQFVGDAPTLHNHLLVNGATDVTITAANLNTLDDNSNSNLHFHDSDRNRSNHTGTQSVSTITGLGTLATQSGTFSGTSSGINTGDESLISIQEKRPLKTINGNSLEGSGNIVISGGGGGATLISGTLVFDFGNEQDFKTIKILNSSISNFNLKSFTIIHLETNETSLDDFNLNGLNFNISNIIDNVSFDITANALNNASGNYTIKYLITI